MKDVGEMMGTRGARLDWSHTYPSDTAYRMAASRLKKAGLIVKREEGAGLPSLRITDKGKAALPAYHAPHQQWDTKWNHIWYVLIFDVPEKERPYRNVLRAFLKHLQMGCLQKSVWVTPRDIRPEYDDLQQAANVHAISYLLESRTVLHRETDEIVGDAWDFRTLETLHERYLAVYGENLAQLETASFDLDSLIALLRQESEAYVMCMRNDPLLPNELHPIGYLGKKVYALHQTVRRVLADHLSQL